MKLRILYFFLVAGLFTMTSCEEANSGKSVENPPADSAVVAKPQPKAPVFAAPEGVASDRQYIYVSNIGAEPDPTTKDGDGYVLRLSLDGSESIDEDKFRSIVMHAPKGMAVVNKVLYVADVDRLFGIDLKKIEKVFEVDFSRFNTTFLNDIAVKDDSTIYLSATDINTIFEVNLIDQSFKSLETEELATPNGLLYSSENGKLYCVESGTKEIPGRFLAIDPPSGRIHELTEHRGRLDGITMLNTGEMVFSDWGPGALFKFNMVSNDIQQIAMDSLDGPADIYHHLATNQLYIPILLGNELKIINGADL